MTPDRLSNVRFAVTRFQTHPRFIANLVRQRQKAFARLDSADYGFEEYDQYAEHLVAFRAGTGAVLGAMRLGPGSRIMQKVGLNGFYLSRYWQPLPHSSSFLSKCIELSRVWLTPPVQDKAKIFSTMWVELGRYIKAYPSFTRMIGTVSVPDFPRRAMEVVSAYFLRFHAPDLTLLRSCLTKVTPDYQYPFGSNPREAFRFLQSELRKFDPPCAIPPLLRLYANEQARLLFPPCIDETGKKLLVPLQFGVEDFMRGLDRRGVSL